MDAKKVLDGFERPEVLQIAAAIPEDVFSEEAVRRGFELPVAVGAAATQGVAELDKPKSEFETSVERFLNPEADLDVDEQLAITSHFWRELGIMPVALNREQRAYIEGVLNANPGKRVMPTPLLSLSDRKNIAEVAKGFSGQKFDTSRSALWVPDESWTFGKLLIDPEGVVTEGRTSYGLRYRLPGGSVVSRAEYAAAMRDAGQALETTDGKTWLFPVMDVRVQSKRTNARADALHAQVNPTMAPESLIAMQLLHQVNGTPNSNWSVDFANEAVYELTSKREAAKKVVLVAGVDWGPYYRQVVLSSWGAGFQGGYFGFRGAESGLKV